jgi:LPS O-antigen subunit length determinant protein (WzzB/FepE family)
MINLKEEIQVLNYYDYPKYLPSKEGIGYKISGQIEGEAGFDYITFSDIKLINQKSEAFRNGTLEISDDMKDEVYKELRVNVNDKNYFTRKMIEDIILDTDDEKLTKIINITSRDTIDNFRRILVKLTNENEYDISNRVREYIDAREYEISKGITKSQLKIPKSKTYKSIQENNIETAVVEDKVVEKEIKSKAKENATE